ncbi:MAG: hypothetical protein VX528_09260 [Candidatus Latescibacterota bacterium]|nr:hypothetical protein [Candidatus Latescibacterota bacterium]
MQALISLTVAGDRMSSKVKEAIEEMIEESYLLGLSQHEVRQDFKRFIDTCYAVIQENVKDRDAVSGLAECLAREQTVILIADRAETERTEAAGTIEEAADQALEAIASDETVDDAARAAHEFSEKVARRKRQILRTIAEVDPRLVRLIDGQRFQGEADEPQRPVFRRQVLGGRVDWSQVRTNLLKVGYATTVALIILLIWLGFMQKS